MLWLFAKPTVWIPGLVLGFGFSVRSWDASFAAGISSFCLALSSWVWWRTDVAWRRWVALRKGQSQARPPGVLRRLVSGILFMFGAAMVCTWLPPMLGLASDKQLFMASVQLRIAQHAAGVVGLLLLFTASRVETRNG